MSARPFVDARSFDFAPGTQRPASVIDVNDTPPQMLEEDGAPTWIARGANFVVAITRARPGTRLVRTGQADEYMVFAPPGVAAEIVAGAERLPVEPDSLTIVPPGDSAVVVQGAGDIFRIFSSRAGNLTVRSANHATYRDGAAEVAPLVDWPAPENGYRLRTYPLRDVTAGAAFGRIYRSTNLMVNIFEPYGAARDQAALSPHSHADFEQGSLTIAGRFEHYLRTPWGKNRTAWRDDLVASCASPSLTVIPAGMIHTTAWLDARGRMIDIFAPPREDFSRQPGWVRNHVDYPLPHSIGHPQ